MSDAENDKIRIRKVCIKSYYLFELAIIYDVSKYRMRKKMKPHKGQIGEPDGYNYNEEQVSLIFCLIKLPSNILIIKV
jgi:hypothetical protein